MAVRVEPSTPAGLRGDVLVGLGSRPKTLPCKYFYDERGSRLFEQICELDVYYLTRAELSIMRAHAGEMASLMGEHVRLVEFGSGAGIKTRSLLDRAHAVAYVPIDISREQLLASASRIATDYPQLEVSPIHGDYTRELVLPPSRASARATVAYFPGSTIGNFTPSEAGAFLERVARMADGLLVGVDLKKDPAVLHAAYNDPQGVTAEFNLNLLARVSTELDAPELRPDRFYHYAFYDPQHGRIEMHLVSKEAHSVPVGDLLVDFDEGESVLTEYSYKYGLREFAALAKKAGFAVRRVWLDERRLFSVQYLTTGG